MKNLARKALRAAVATGKIKKEPCKVCKNPKVEGHHPDHNKRFEVIWLCSKHHRIEENKKFHASK